jgi:hypothetical protein
MLNELDVSRDVLRRCGLGPVPDRRDARRCMAEIKCAVLRAWFACGGSARLVIQLDSGRFYAEITRTDDLGRPLRARVVTLAGATEGGAK